MEDTVRKFESNTDSAAFMEIGTKMKSTQQLNQ